MSGSDSQPWCADPWQYVNGSCMRIYTDKLGYWESRDFCLQTGVGGDLGSVKNAGVEEYLISWMGELKGSSYPVSMHVDCLMTYNCSIHLL